MALIKFGGGITEMRGSIAGNVYSRNRYGAYARARTKPVNPSTSKQVSVRSAISYLTELWHTTLTASQRTAWGTYAASVSMKNKLGEVIQLSGFNHFIRSNAILQAQGLTVVVAGPTELSLPEKDSTFAVAGSAASGEITLTFDDTQDWCDEDDSYLVVYVGRPRLVTRNFFAGPWQYGGKVDGDSVAPPATGEVITSPFTLIEGQKVTCYGRIIRADGRVTEAFTAECVIAA